jgi:hypothetical protein
MTHLGETGGVRRSKLVVELLHATDPVPFDFRGDGAKE